MKLTKNIFRTCFILMPLFTNVVNAGFFDKLTEDATKAINNVAKDIADDFVQKKKPAPETTSSQPDIQVTNAGSDSVGSQHGGAPRVVLSSVNPDRMSLRVPEISENPAMTPVNIKLSPPLQPGEVLKVYVDGHLVSSMTASGFNIERYRQNVYLVGNTTIDVGVFSPQGTLVSSTRSKKINVPTQFLVDIPPPGRIDKRTGKYMPYASSLDFRKTYVRKRRSGESILTMEYRHDLAPADVRRIFLSTDSGSISLTITGYAAKNASITGPPALYLDKDPETVKYSIHSVDPDEKD